MAEEGCEEKSITINGRPLLSNFAVDSGSFVPPSFPRITPAVKFDGIDRLTAIIRSIDVHVSPFKKIIEDFARALQPVASALGRYADARNVLRSSGLLPHITTPWYLYDADVPDVFAHSVEAYYQENWNAIEADICSRVESYLISPEAKAGFHDSIACHRHGIYRAAVSVAFPVVEAEFRRKFAVQPGEAATSLKELREAIGSSPIGIAMHRVETIGLMRILDEHLFEQVTSLKAIDRFKSDDVPNRHAATHGLLEYTTHKNSLNAIIIADHALFMMNLLQEMSNEAKAAESKS
jgi:hypothetical protein